MPLIYLETRLVVDGAHALSLTKRTPLQVDSTQLYTLNVPAAIEDLGGRRKNTKRPGEITFSLPFGDVKFAAIYSGGQPGGLSVKVGNTKIQTLEQPLILTQDRATRLRLKTVRFKFENNDTVEKNISIMVGFNLPKEKKTTKKKSSKRKVAKKKTTKKKAPKRKTAKRKTRKK